MLKNAFAGQAKAPTNAELAAALGKAAPVWQALITDLKRDLNLDAEEWSCYSVKAGWSLRLQSKKRNIVYLSPGAGAFLASFALGDRAVAAARKSKLAREVLKIIAGARRYAEGTAVRIEVRAPGDAEVVKTLAKIKLDN